MTEFILIECPETQVIDEIIVLKITFKSNSRALVETPYASVH